METANNNLNDEPINESGNRPVEEFTAEEVSGTEFTSEDVSSEQEPRVENMRDEREHEERSRANHSMFYRHPTDKLAGGVCGGIADYLGWEPVMVRILWVVVTLFTAGFAGLAVYGALWLLLPVGTIKDGQVDAPAISLSERNIVPGALVLIGLGIIWLLSNVGVLGSLVWVMSFVGMIFWPTVLIGIGYLMLREVDSEKWSYDNLGANLGQARDKVRDQASKFSNSNGGNMNDFKNGFSRIRQSIPFKRSREDRIALGVCGGIGEKLGFDANLVRFVWIAASIASVGLGVFGYLILAVVLPEDGAEMGHDEADDVHRVQIISNTASKMV